MKDVVLLHGALGCKSHWNHILPLLDSNYTYHNLDFPLHGGTDSDVQNLSLEVLTDYVKSVVKSKQLNEFIIVGYSMGGYIGLDMARHHFPGLKQLITLGTKLNWNEEIAEHEVSKLSIENLTPIHGKLQQEHGEKWQDVVFATHAIMRSIGQKPISKEDFSDIHIPVSLLLGEKDKMVTTDETISFSEHGSTSRYEIIPAQPHLLERVDASIIAGKINALLNSQQKTEA